MKRMITKKMRDSFNVSFMAKINYMHKIRDRFSGRKTVGVYFKETEKQRILILRRTVK